LIFRLEIAMSILDRVKGLFAPQGGGDANVMWLYVRCSRCGTPLAVRVDLRNELSADYEHGGYILHKEMMDSTCFTLMHAQVRFDDQRKVIEQSVEKGELMTQEEYEKAMSPSPNEPNENDR
jgi:hypothetical protein